MTDEELAYIAEHYATMTPKEIGKSADRVRQVARRKLGLLRHPARVTENRCRGCQIWAGRCIHGNEGNSTKCNAMRYTAAEWPKKLTPIQEMFNNL